MAEAKSLKDPLSGSAWSSADMVAGFAQSPPNNGQIALADAQRGRGPAVRAIDIGCGAGRNAVPLARSGWHVLGSDLSWPMLEAARDRARTEGVRLDLALAPMQVLPVASRSADLVIAHGIWNLARTGAEFRSAVRNAARVARPGAGLFLFTFSRRTLPPGAAPDPGEAFVFSSWANEPHCFLTETEVIDELAAAGFVRDAAGPLTEYNAPGPGDIRLGGGPPVIYEGTFVRR